MDITKDTLYQNLLFSTPVYYTENMVLYPVKMEDIIPFNMYKQSITIRKNSTFPIKKIIKMTYLDFLFYCHGNEELAKEYEMPFLPLYYSYALMLLKLVFKGQEVLGNSETGGFKINGTIITADQFDDIRRIIIIQNGIDFDIDEFIQYDTEHALMEAKNSLDSKDSATLEDYIDSVCLGMNLTECQVQELTIRKFWRYVKRVSKRDMFTILKTAESGGMVKFKEPVEYWMCCIDGGDKYEDVKTDSQSLHQMIGG